MQSNWFREDLARGSFSLLLRVVNARKARPAWDIVRRETVTERLDSQIFWFLYWVGTFSGTFALI
jgi:hypothetical protein